MVTEQNKIPFAETDDIETPRFTLTSVLEELFGSIFETEASEENYKEVLDRIGTA